MGLRCSLLGHDFGDPEVEREREERGSEVVLTVREISDCTRCGKTSVVSENKEVTAIEGDADEDDAVERTDDEASEPSIAEATDSSTDDASEPDGDDAIIMPDEDAESDSEDRAHGEWPDHDHQEEPPADVSARSTEWPETSSDDEGFDAQPSTGGSAAVDFGGGLTPEQADAEQEAGLEYVESAEPDAADAEAESPVEDDTGFVRADAASTPSKPDIADVDMEFICPRCEFVDDSIGSSLRAGDICPECRKGYLAERER